MRNCHEDDVNGINLINPQIKHENNDIKKIIISHLIHYFLFERSIF